MKKKVQQIHGNTFLLTPLTNALQINLTTKQQPFFFNLMKKYSFRIFLRNLLDDNEKNHKHLYKYGSKQKISIYLQHLKNLALISDNNTINLSEMPNRPSFSQTFTWFIKDLLEEELKITVYSQLSCLHLKHGGEIDILIPKLYPPLIIELKTSPPANIDCEEVIAFYNRTRHYVNYFHIFFCDTYYRLEDKIIPMFEETIFLTLGPEGFITSPLIKIDNDMFHIPPNIIILNARRSVRKQLMKAILITQKLK